ncbi:MAG: class I SAM-dependent methyltransferase [Thermodesulfobacteriota bacterium]
MYPVEVGIPLLVRDWKRHEEEIQKVRATNTDWYFEEQLPELISPWRHHLRKRQLYVETAIAQYLSNTGKTRAKTLLDMGCGDGNNLEYLRRYTEGLFGSDYNLIRLLRARSRQYGITLFLADILDYPVRDDFFDIIFFNHVIEHIPDDAKALETVFRILKPKGLLVLGTPNEGVWWWQLAYRLQPETLKNTDHLHFYTAEMLSAKLVSKGFKLIEIQHMGWGPPHWSIDRWIRRFKVMDDFFEYMGRLFFPYQASSLYILATKE